MSEEIQVLAAAATTISAAGIWRTLRAARKNAEAFRRLMERHTAEREIPRFVHTETGRKALAEE